MIHAKPITIRPAELGEVPLSIEERRFAIRDGVHPVERPTWHPEIIRNFSVMSARIHRRHAEAT